MLTQLPEYLRLNPRGRTRRRDQDLPFASRLASFEERRSR